jgi:hypothetical protein
MKKLKKKSGEGPTEGCKAINRRRHERMEIIHKFSVARRVLFIEFFTVIGFLVLSIL